MWLKRSDFNPKGLGNKTFKFWALWLLVVLYLHQSLQEKEKQSTLHSQNPTKTESNENRRVESIPSWCMGPFTKSFQLFSSSIGGPSPRFWGFAALCRPFQGGFMRSEQVNSTPGDHRFWVFMVFPLANRVLLGTFCWHNSYTVYCHFKVNWKKMLLRPDSWSRMKGPKTQETKKNIVLWEDIVHVFLANLLLFESNLVKEPLYLQ